MRVNSSDIYDGFNPMSTHDEIQCCNFLLMTSNLIFLCCHVFLLSLSLDTHGKKKHVSIFSHSCAEITVRVITLAPIAMCLASVQACQMITQQQSYVVTQMGHVAADRKQTHGPDHCSLCFTVFSAYCCSLGGENLLNN